MEVNKYSVTHITVVSASNHCCRLIGTPMALTGKVQYQLMMISLEELEEIFDESQRDELQMVLSPLSGSDLDLL